MAEKMVDKVLRIMKIPGQIRNIAIAAHIDHGKTTFTDNLLAGAGMMSKEDAGKALKMDFHADEQERGITIDTAAVSMVHEVEGEEYLVNLLDTPGHVDFGGDVTRAMRAVDGTIILIDAVEGIMPQTETVVRQALRELVKPVLFINKVDRLINELKLAPEQMQERFVRIITDVNRFIKQIAPKEIGEKLQVSVSDGSVSFGSAFHNWALNIPYMQKKGITFKNVIEAYTSSGKQEAQKKLAEQAPLHEVVLNMVVRHLPNPLIAQEYRVPKIWHGDIESPEGVSLTKCDPHGPLFFVITKIVIDPQAGEIAAGRLFSGTMKKGTEVYLHMMKSGARVQQVFIYNGAKREIVDHVPAGNIIGISGARSYAGETVAERETEPFEAIKHIFDPVITKAIEAAKPSDLPKLVEVLKQVSKEDPTIKVEINEQTGEHLIHGMGELHLEVIENRIKTEKGVDVKTSPPIVVYRETVTKSGPEVEGKSPNKHNKLYFVVEPLEDSLYAKIKDGTIPEMRIKKRDLKLREHFIEAGYDAKTADKVRDVFKGNILIDGTRGIVHIGEIIEMVQDMFEDVMNLGPICKEPAAKVKATLIDAKLHEDSIHRGPAQMYPAIRDGIRGSFMLAGPQLLEPMQILHIEAPEEFMGEISKIIGNKRGQLLDMAPERGLVIVKAKLPVAEMFGWSSDLRSATGGRGNSSLIDQMFERIPHELQQKVVSQIKERKGLTEAMVGA